MEIDFVEELMLLRITVDIAFVYCEPWAEPNLILCLFGEVLCCDFTCYLLAVSVLWSSDRKPGSTRTLFGLRTL